MDAAVRFVFRMFGSNTHYLREQFPLAVEAVQNKCYRENLMLSIKGIEEAKAIWEKITELEDLARLNVGEWISHQPKVIQDIPEQEDSYSNEKDMTVQMFIQMFVCLHPIQIEDRSISRCLISAKTRLAPLKAPSIST